MKEETIVKIENNLLRLIKMIFEIESKIDRFGHVVYNTDIIAEKMNNTIKKYAEELNESEDDVKEVILRILECEESQNKELQEENKSIKKILQTYSKDNKSAKKIRDNIENEKIR